MESVIEFISQFQGEIATAVGLILSRYVPAGWRVIFRKSGDLAEWWSEFVDSVPPVKTSSSK